MSVCTVPIFPLEGVYLCPGLLLPLHIFEPRYRAMITHALEGDRRIAIAVPAPGHSTQTEEKPPVHEICGLGEIVEHQVFPDGRANILLRGCGRLRIHEELPLTDDGYRLVRAKEAPEELCDDADLTEGLARVLVALEDLGGVQVEPLSKLPAQQLVDSALLALPLPSTLKLELFSELSVEKRLHRLIDNLPGPSDPGHPSLEFRPDDPRLN